MTYLYSWYLKPPLTFFIIDEFSLFPYKAANSLKYHLGSLPGFDIEKIHF